MMDARLAKNIKSRIGEKFITNEGYEVTVINYEGVKNVTIKYIDGTIFKNISYTNLRNGKIKKPCNRIGEKHITNEGYSVEIVEYKNSNRCTIKYDDGEQLIVTYSDLKKGAIRKPCNRVGSILLTNEGYEVEIIEYFNSYNCTIRFHDDRNTTLYNILYSSLAKGAVSNPYHKSLYDIGYFGEGVHISSFSNKRSKKYSLWASMIARCYSDANKYSAYKDCTVDEKWHNFQNFAQWFEENYNPEIMKDWHLDKDILQKGNKIYSPETCCFVPAEINTLLLNRRSSRGKYPLGVKKEGMNYSSCMKRRDKSNYLGMFSTPEEAFEIYKKEKQLHIKEVAGKWRDKIDPRVYQSLTNYKVEITD